MIKIKLLLSGWKEVDEEQAKEFVIFLKKNIINITESKKNDYINENRIRGVTVEELLNG